PSKSGPGSRSWVSLHCTPGCAFPLLITRLYIDHKPVWLGQPERPVAAGPVDPEAELHHSLEILNALDLDQGRVARHDVDRSVVRAVQVGPVDHDEDAAAALGRHRHSAG